MKVKALVLEKLHKRLQYKEVELSSDPSLETVEIRAAALNRRDYWITKGLYPGITLPAILGSDGCGLWNGDEVLINPNVGWGDSEMPLPAYKILGLENNGCFSQKIMVPRDRIYQKPTHLDYIQAAALPLAGLTAYRALFNKGKLTPNEKAIIDRAFKIMKQRNAGYFYVSSLLGKKSRFQVKDAEDILKLIKKGIFVPIIIFPE